MHPFKRLIETGNKILSAAEIPIRAGPHVIARLGGNEQLVAMRMPVAIHMDAEVALRLAVRRTVVVGQVKVRDPVVERGAQQALLHAEGRNIAEIVPQAKRNGGQQYAARAAAAILHGGVSVFRGNVGHCAFPPVSV